MLHGGRARPVRRPALAARHRLARLPHRGAALRPAAVGVRARPPRLDHPAARGAARRPHARARRSKGLEPQRTLCFSSDYPHWDFDDPRQTLKRLPPSGATPSRTRNAARFFGLEARGAGMSRAGGADPARRRCRRPASIRMLEVGGHRVGLVRVGDELHALADRCPHRGAPLCSGGRTVHGIQLGDGAPVRGAERALVRCPWHKWDFDIASGRCLVHPTLRVRRYRVTVERGARGRAPASIPSARRARCSG